MQAKVHIAEVDYYYCLYYPPSQPFRPPPGPKQAVKSSTATRRHRQEFWDLVQQHMSDGTLRVLEQEWARANAGSQNAQQGQFEATSTTAQLFRRAENTEGTSEIHSLALAGADDVDSHASDDSDEDEDGGEGYGEYDYDESDDEDDDEAEESDYENKDSEQMMLNLNGAEQGSRKHHEVNAKTETGATSPGRSEAPGPVKEFSKNAGSASVSEEGETKDTDQNDAGDALMEYSNSNGFQATIAGPVHLSKNLRKLSVLAELSAESLNSQLRYFYPGKASAEVDLQQPTRCLNCGDVEHESDSCQTLRCQHCNARAKHLTVLCPKKAKCSKCREGGHTEDTCPYKLKRVTKEEITCDICLLNGHLEQDCELIWRTSGKPWDFDASQHKIELFCYECGNQGHLGNDCSSRQPGKSLGSSTWTLLRNFDVSVGFEAHPRQPARPKYPVKKDELKIRGRAQKQPTNRSSNTGQDEAGFLHPRRQPQPSQSGRIQIAPVNAQRVDRPQHRGFTPINQSGATYNARWREDQSSYSYQSTSSTSGRQDNYRQYPGDSRRSTYPHRYRSRSRSPPREDRRQYQRNAPFRNYPPAPGTTQDVYHPMPSAAQKAWTKHRL